VTEYLELKKRSISTSIEKYIDATASQFTGIKPWGEDVFTRIRRYSLQGKMLRGSLVCLGHDLYGGTDESAALASAVAMELFQSGLLIHDDIMDRDEMRRGAPSLHYQYANIFKAEEQFDYYHQGESFGICGGDIAFFLAFDSLSQAHVSVSAMSLCARELTAVCLGQMNDVYFGASKAHTVTAEEVMRLYELKTGRYTFSLPLMLGAALAGKYQSEELSRLGEIMGVIFQIRDDELGLFGDSTDIGKPTGTDIREGKRTLFYLEMKKRMSPTEWVRASGIFGNMSCTLSEVQWVQGMMDACGARAEVLAVMERLKNEAFDLISKTAGNEGYKNELRGILSYICAREK
jgi:geranylgeranyl diphosphate synthase type I